MVKKAIFDKKNILVTGGAGFIGSHLCDELVKENKVICLDDFSTGDEGNIDHLLSNPDFEFVKHNVSEPINLESLPGLQKFKIEFQGIQEVYNLACPMSPKDFNKNKIETVLANSVGVKNALDLALKNEAKFLHLSSSVVYGLSNRKVKEKDEFVVDHLSPRAVYDEGKRFAETLVDVYHSELGLDAKIARVFRIYGPRMKINDGQMIPDFVEKALNREDLTIFGDDNFTSSFCYISDCIDALIKLMESSINTPINIGSDVEINIVDVAKKILEYTESKSEITFTDEMLFMKPLCTPDISKARNDLGWMPVVTIDTGLKKTIEELKVGRGLKGVHNAL